MRVIAGLYKGHTLKAPNGNNTRPTTDRVRESLFSTLVSARGGLNNAVVLDAFAGSGALGIEALSRGAAYAVFCEQNAAALAALKKNLSFVNPDCVSVVAGNVLKRTILTPQSFDMLFFDPPYALESSLLVQLLEKLDRAGALAAGALVSYEFDASNAPSPLMQNGNPLELHLVTTKTFGNTSIDIYRKGTA